ncbi:MAG: AMP-binding protein [Acidobacteriota bacterium]|nr:AMP-binding protein [Acidobacteriota bacterium]
MARLYALDIDLGPSLEAALRECVERSRAFCVLDRRLAPRRRDEELARLGATHVVSEEGVVALASGREVDETVGAVVLTSGSSGPAKAAELTWDALAASARLTQATLRDDGPPTWYPCLPACHVGGLAVVLRAILDDARLLWGARDDLAGGARGGATHIAVVRTQLARHDLSGYRRVLLGGARPPADRPANVVTTWGMTETGSGVVYDGVALPGVDVASVAGELLVRSPTLFAGYRDAPRPRAPGPDGRADWFPTGDAGEVEGGRVSVRGRLASVITTGGEKVWPEDLEAAFIDVPGVRDIAVTAVEDPEWGERVVALVVGEAAGLDDALRERAEERIGPWAKPKEVRHVVAIPRTDSGKVRRGGLADLH